MGPTRRLASSHTTRPVQVAQLDPASHPRRRSWVLSLGTLLACVLVVGLLHGVLILTAQSLVGWSPMRVLDFAYVRNTGTSFGLFAESTFAKLVYHTSLLLIAIVVAAILCSLANSRYLVQFVAIHLFAASALVVSGERLISGHATTYLVLWFPSEFSLGVFSLPDLIIFAVAAISYPFTLFKFLRRRAPPEAGKAIGPVADPFYELRLPLKTLLVLTGTLFIIQIGSPVITVSAYALQTAYLSDRPTIIFSTVVVLFILIVGVVLFMRMLWRLIPDRPIDVVFLRAFQDDPAATQSLKSLRNALGRKIRLTGVTDPKEAPRIRMLPLYLFFFPFLALGDFAYANAFRHTVFLVGHWKDGVQSILNSAVLSVFECGQITENLAWELEHAIQTQGADSVMILHPSELGRDNIVSAFRDHGVAYAVIARIPQDHWFDRPQIDAAARTILGSLHV